MSFKTSKKKKKPLGVWPRASNNWKLQEVCPKDSEIIAPWTTDARRRAKSHTISSADTLLLSASRATNDTMVWKSFAFDTLYNLKIAHQQQYTHGACYNFVFNLVSNNVITNISRLHTVGYKKTWPCLKMPHNILYIRKIPAEWVLIQGGTVGLFFLQSFFTYMYKNKFITFCMRTASQFSCSQLLQALKHQDSQTDLHVYI